MKTIDFIVSVVIFAVIVCSGTTNALYAESLNPEGINPHVEAPRKKISEEQKKAAWEARKKKQAEIEALKAQQDLKNKEKSIIIK